MGLLATECLGGSIVFEGASVSHTPDVTVGMSRLCISGMGCHRPSVLRLVSSQYSAKCTRRMPLAMRKAGRRGAIVMDTGHYAAYAALRELACRSKPSVTAGDSLSSCVGLSE